MQDKELQKIVRANTIISIHRLNVLEQLLRVCKHLPGDAAEVGVLKGGSAYLAASILSDKHVYLFDTFSGLTEDMVDVTKDRHVVGAFSNTTLEHVQNLLKDMSNVSIHVGVFPKQNSEVVKDKQFCYVHLDCDLYYSVKEGLNFFYPRLVKNGLIILDDYGDHYCTGVRLAAHEFLQENPDLELRELCECQWGIIKND